MYVVELASGYSKTEALLNPATLVQHKCQILGLKFDKRYVSQIKMGEQILSKSAVYIHYDAKHQL